MNFLQKQLAITLEIPDTLLDELWSHGLRHYPREFGGILVGHYSEDETRCYVRATILPTTFKSSRYGFERGNTGLAEPLIKYYNSNPRLIYVGEWHTHPDAGPNPSKTDIEGMGSVEASSSVLISSPILIIIGMTQKTYSVGAFVQHSNKLYRYEKL